MSPQAAFQQIRHTRIAALGVFAALGIIGGAFVVPVMAQQAQNQAPVAQPDTATTPEDTAVTIAVLANDTDPDGNPLSVVGFVAPSHGSVVVNAATTVTYTPTMNFSGSDTFTYTLSDGQGGTAAGTVTVTVTPVNDPPIGVVDAATSTGGAITIAVLANDSDVDGDTLTIASVTQGAHGTVAVSAGNLTLVYTPVVGFSGTDTFTYVVSDGHGGTATVVVTVTVAATNRTPIAMDDAATVKQDMSKTIAVLANDSDPDGDSLSISATTPPAHGSIVVNADQTITYTPVAGFTGSDTFTYTVRDSAGATATANVALTVKTEVLVTPEDKDECKHGGFILLGFKNQGLCVAAVNHLNHEDNDDDEADVEHEAEHHDNRGPGSSTQGSSFGHSHGHGSGHND